MISIFPAMAKELMQLAFLLMKVTIAADNITLLNPQCNHLNYSLPNHFARVLELANYNAMTILTQLKVGAYELATLYH